MLAKLPSTQGLQDCHFAAKHIKVDTLVLVQGEHANEAQGFRDDGSSICDSNSYIWPRSEASQDSHFDQDGWGRQAFNDFESRYPTVPTPAPNLPGKNIEEQAVLLQLEEAQNVQGSH